MHRIYRLLLLLALCPTALRSQSNGQVSNTFLTDVRELELNRQLWLHTRNAAGLSILPIADGGISSASIHRSEGSHRRVQEGQSENGLTLQSDHFDNLNDSVFFYGRFGFEMSRVFDRAWSDVFDAYRGNPYTYGSSILGNYDKQVFDLFTKVATRSFGRFTFGVQVSYQVGSLARLRDPRSLTNLVDYSLIPALTYRLNKKQTLGLTLNYGRRKEKTSNVSTVQTDATLKYYNFTGMEHATGTIGGYSSFKREFVNNTFGIGVDHAFTNGAFKILNSILYDNSLENCWGTNKQSPGVYGESQYQFVSHSTFETNDRLHTLALNATLKNGKADEFRQELISTTDTATGIISKHWNTLYTYQGRFQTSSTDVSAHYRQYLLRQAGGYKGWFGAKLAYQSFENRYLLPESSLSVQSMAGTLEGSLALLNTPKSSLWLESSCTWMQAMNADLSLQDASTDLAVNVLLPDMNYYNASYLQAGGRLVYNFPVTYRKISHGAFLALGGDYAWVSASKNVWSVALTAGFHIQ